MRMRLRLAARDDLGHLRVAPKLTRTVRGLNQDAEPGTDVATPDAVTARCVRVPSTTRAKVRQDPSLPAAALPGEPEPRRVSPSSGRAKPEMVLPGDSLPGDLRRRDVARRPERARARAAPASKGAATKRQRARGTASAVFARRSLVLSRRDRPERRVPQSPNGTTAADGRLAPFRRDPAAYSMPLAFGRGLLLRVDRPDGRRRVPQGAPRAGRRGLRRQRARAGARRRQPPPLPRRAGRALLRPPRTRALRRREGHVRARRRAASCTWSRRRRDASRASATRTSSCSSSGRRTATSAATATSRLPTRSSRSPPRAPARARRRPPRARPGRPT